jgi:hypothetical protein
MAPLNAGRASMSCASSSWVRVSRASFGHFTVVVDVCLFVLPAQDKPARATKLVINAIVLIGFLLS